MKSLLRPIIPVLFVLLWSTGFIMARYGMESAEPASFLALRFSLAALALVVLTLLIPSLRVPVSDWNQIGHSAVAGVLLQAVYLGGVFAGVNQGIGAGLSSLIVGIQPVLTVMLATLWLAETLDRTKVAGIVMGFAGVCLVTMEWGLLDGALSVSGIGFCIAALLGITLGTIYQKRFCHSLELHHNMIAQYIAASLFLLPFAFFSESFAIDWTSQLVFVMTWLVVVLSIGAVFLLMWLIRAGEAGRVSTLFFLVPPVVAIEAWFLFREPLTINVMIGTILAILGVAMVNGLLKRPRTLKVQS